MPDGIHHSEETPLRNRDQVGTSLPEFLDHSVDRCSSSQYLPKWQFRSYSGKVFESLSLQQLGEGRELAAVGTIFTEVTKAEPIGTNFTEFSDYLPKSLWYGASSLATITSRK